MIICIPLEETTHPEVSYVPWGISGRTQTRAACPEQCLPVCPDRAPAEGISRACVRQGCEELHQSVTDTFFLSQNRREGVCGPTRAAGRVEWNCVRAQHTCTPEYSETLAFVFQSH